MDGLGVVLEVRPVMGPVVYVNPLNVVLARPLQRRALEHVDDCMHAGTGSADQLCMQQGCLKELPDGTELLLVNTLGQDSAVQMDEGTEEFVRRWDDTLMRMVHPLVTMQASGLRGATELDRMRARLPLRCMDCSADLTKPGSISYGAGDGSDAPGQPQRFRCGKCYEAVAMRDRQ